MNLEEFKKILKEGLVLNNISINLNNEKQELLFKYMKYILDKNKYINLTAIKDKKDFIYKHYIDCFHIIKYIKKGKLIDIGTGGGFPGIPLLIVIDDLEVTFLDSTKKKLKVIEEFIFENNISKAIFIHDRAEKLNKNENYKNTYDYVTTRAVSNIKNIIDYTLPYLKKDGLGIAMRGKLEEEVEILKNTNISKVDKYNLVDQNNIKNERNILLLKK